jgi:hypothetical protein
MSATIAEMKAYLKKYKSVHGKPISKMSKTDMEALSHVVKQHEKMASMPEHEFEKHVAEMKKMRDHVKGGVEKKEKPMEKKHEEKPMEKKVRKSSESQMAHRKAFAEWAKSGKKITFSEFKAEHGEKHSKHEKKPVEKEKPMEKKAEVVQKDEEEDLRVALGRKPRKVEKFVVEKELVEDLSSKSKKKSA